MTTIIETPLQVPDPQSVTDYFSKNPGTHRFGCKLADRSIILACNSKELLDRSETLFTACLMKEDEVEERETDLFLFHQPSLEPFASDLVEYTFTKLGVEKRSDWSYEDDDYIIYYQTPDLLSYWDKKSQKIYSFYGRLGVNDIAPENVDKASQIKIVMSDTYFITVSDHMYLLMADLIGAICFHGAFVEVGGKGLLLTGLSGAGKSTTSLSLFREGASLFSDEIVFLSKNDGAVWGEGLPISPRLVGSTVRKLDELEHSITSTEEIDKSDVDLTQFPRKISSESKRKIDAVLFFERPEGDRPATHSLKEMEPMELFDHLNRQLLGYNFPELSGKRMQLLLDLVSEAGTYKFVPGTSLSTIYPYLKENL